MTVHHSSTGHNSRQSQVLADSLPSELKAVRHWVGFRLLQRRGKVTKVPIDPKTGRKASSTNPSTWVPFDDAWDFHQAGRADGVGFVFADDDPFSGIDLDNCLNPQTGELTPFAADVVRKADSYTEISLLGRGVKLIVRGKLPPGVRCVNRKLGIEMYSRGRFFALTGNRLTRTPATINERQAELEGIHAGAFEERKQTAVAGHQADAPARCCELSDQEILDRARNAKNGAKFARLFAGDADGYGSESEADLAFCSEVAFWVGPDPERIDRIFRQSGRMRDKWEREDYRRRTISKALVGRTEYYGPATPIAQLRYSSDGQGNHQGNGKGLATIQLGPFALRPERARKTPGGKIVQPVVVVAGEKIVDRITVADSAAGRREAGKLLAQHFAEDAAERKQIPGVLTQLIALAAEQLDAGHNPSGLTLADIVRRDVPPVFRLAYRTDRGAWSEARGAEVTRVDFATFLSNRLLSAAATAGDAPADASGNISRLALARAIRVELEAAWGDLIEQLPAAPAAALGKNTAAGRKFWEAMVRLWTATRTFEVTKGTESTSVESVVARASLISRVRTQARDYLDGTVTARAREKWRETQRAFACWWRPCVRSDGELTLALAMRWELTGQIGLELPGVSDQLSLSELGVRFGVVDPHPPVTTMLSGGTQRLVVLSAELTAELLAVPVDSLPDTASGDAGDASDA
jgi:hypothetical protein